MPNLSVFLSRSLYLSLSLSLSRSLLSYKLESSASLRTAWIDSTDRQIDRKIDAEMHRCMCIYIYIHIYTGIEHQNRTF